MRIISGIARGRKLSAPSGEDIRPTTDNVKEAMFNIIQFDIEGRKVLDLFAGTGQLGIECLSRGAASAVFVDSSRDAVKTVRANLNACGLTDRATVVLSDALTYLNRCGKADIILFDPPYDSNLYEVGLGAINSFDILNNSGIIMCESRRERELPAMTEPYFLRREYKYGSIKLSVFERRQA